MSEVNPSNSLSGMMDSFFIDKVSELSHGSITITLHTDGILGDNAAVMEVMTRPKSEIHLARVSPAALAQYHCEKTNLVEIPFTFRNHAHFQKFALSPAAETILNEPYEKGIGVKGLFLSEEGFRHFFSTKKLTSIEDFNGKPVRTAGTTIMAGIITGLKAQPVSISFSNLYSALQTGAVDIAEQPIANYYSNHFNKIAPYMILDGHQLGVTEVIITSETWDALSKQQQQALIEAGKYAQEAIFKILQESEEKDKLMLKNEGVEFTEITDITAWQKACADIINYSVKSNTELYGEIITLAD